MMTIIPLFIGAISLMALGLWLMLRRNPDLDHPSVQRYIRRCEELGATPVDDWEERRIAAGYADRAGDEVPDAIRERSWRAIERSARRAERRAERQRGAR